MSRRPLTTIIAHHLIPTLYAHWPPNDPRGSGSLDFIDDKLEPLGPIHHGRKPAHEQPSRDELRAFHDQASALMNFPVFWIDEAKRQAFAEAFRDVVHQQGYTCYACAICANHAHLVIRVHRDDALTMFNHFADSARERLRLRFPNEISPHHPVISARPYKVFLHTPDEVRQRIDYVEGNPLKEGLAAQKFDFVVPYDDWPFHKQRRA